MSRRTRTLSPLSLGLFAWSAGMVFAARGAKLWGDPRAGTTLAGMAAEKQRALVEGSQAAGWAMLRGATPARVLAAGLGPARRRVRANLAKL